LTCFPRWVWHCRCIAGVNTARHEPSTRQDQTERTNENQTSG
jgi:hypothetical protein